jgi:transposase-like protein
MRWLAETLPDGKRASACRNYMRLAHHREYVDPTLSLTSNLLLVCGLEKREIGTPRHSPETKARVLAVAGEGHTMAEIARRTGVTKSTVHAWLDPAWAADKTARAREQQRDRRAQARGGEPESEELAEPDPRSRRYGEPGRAAIGRAVRRLAQVQGKDATREALLDLAAICRAWAERLGAPFDGPNEAEAA